MDYEYPLAWLQRPTIDIDDVLYRFYPSLSLPDFPAGFFYSLQLFAGLLYCWYDKSEADNADTIKQ